MHTRQLAAILVFASLWPATGAYAHTLFIKPDPFVIEPNEPFIVNIINGTFLTSENRIRKSMARSAGIIGPGNADFDFANSDWVSKDNMSVLSAQLEKPGNYVIAVTTEPQKITLDAETFNYYLRYEGLFDQQEERERLGETGTEVVEKYQKFAKALVQVGDVHSANYSTELGFDVEIVPVTNPYTLTVGDTFSARVLRDGEPIENMRVFATHEGYLPQDEEGIFDEAVKVLSNSDGIVEFAVTEPGKWYVRFIDLKRESDSEYWYSSLLASIGADEKRIVYASKWATLTFEIR